MSSGHSISIEPVPGGRHRLECRLVIPRPVDDVFPFFADAHNLEAITPNHLKFNVVTPAPIEMKPGTFIDYKLSLRGVPFRWRTRIPVWDPPRRFVDEQIKGPYKLWCHEHTFEAVDDGTATLMVDRVDYKLPMGPLGTLAHGLFVERDLRNIFNYRSERIIDMFGEQRAQPSSSATEKRPPAVNLA